MDQFKWFFCNFFGFRFLCLKPYSYLDQYKSGIYFSSFLVRPSTLLNIFFVLFEKTKKVSHFCHLFSSSFFFWLRIPQYSHTDFSMLFTFIWIGLVLPIVVVIIAYANVNRNPKKHVVLSIFYHFDCRVQTYIENKQI